VGPSVPGVLLARGITLTTSGAQERQGIVQRLDVGTSGLMVLAKSEAAYAVLKQAFRDRAVQKTYHALVQGHPEPAEGTIDTPIARSSRHDYKFTISAGGKPAVTHYRLIELLPTAALVEVGLETGRTHQIRVHFAHFNHPLVGDDLYGSDPKLAQKLGLRRQWLHAVKLAFEHPITKQPVEFSSKYPSDLEIALEALRDVSFRL
jgi:23S rRNA pseudouridine1911/1915/1917 synthase